MQYVGIDTVGLDARCVLDRYGKKVKHFKERAVMHPKMEKLGGETVKTEGEAAVKWICKELEQW